MKYNLDFKKSALKEWKKLDPHIRDQFRSKLKERLETPHVESAKLSGMSSCYKIKLRDSGYRLVYQVHDDQILVVVIAVGKRDKNQVYEDAIHRLSSTSH